MEELAFAFLECLFDDENRLLAYEIKEEMLSRAGDHAQVFIDQAQETRKLCGIEDPFKVDLAQS